MDLFRRGGGSLFFFYFFPIYCFDLNKAKGLLHLTPMGIPLYRLFIFPGPLEICKAKKQGLF